VGGNGKNSDGRRGTAVIYLVLRHRAGGAGSGWIWRRRRHKKWNQTDMRSTERVKGEQCRDLGGQPKT